MNKFFFKNFEKICKKKYPLFQSYIVKKNHQHYEMILRELVKILNTQLKISLKKNSWNLILGPWLKNNIDIFVHKETLIKNQNLFKKHYKYKKINKITVPKDYTDFTNYLNDDRTNENLFLYLLYKNSNFKFSYEQKSFSSIILFVKSLKNLFSIFIIKIFFRSSSKNTIILDNPFFTSAGNKKIFENFKKKNKNIFFYPYSNLRNFANFFIFNINFHKREKIIKDLLSGIIKTRNKKLLIYLIATIPLYYFENFKFVNFLSKILFLGDKFYARVAQLDNEFFKFYRANKKSKVFLDQHGGNYSFINEDYYLFYEKFYGNKIYYWDKLNNKKFNSKFNSLKIIVEGQKKYNQSKENEICYIMSFKKIFDYQNFFHEHFDYNFSINSLLNFNKHCKKFVKIKIAPKRHNYQIDEKTLLKLNFKKNQISINKQDIYNSKILIYDGLGSGLFETRMQDIPFIIIMKKNNYFLSKVGIKIINKLEKINLIFEDSKKAAKYIDKINDMDKWWRSKKNIVNEIFYSKDVKFKI